MWSEVRVLACVSLAVVVSLPLCPVAFAQTMARRNREVQKPTLPQIVEAMARMGEHNQAERRPYTVLRAYSLYPESKPSQLSQVTAEVSFVPPEKQDFVIRSTQGGGEGPRVVRQILEHESEMLTRWRETAIIPENYKFSLEREDMLEGHRCYVLAIEPRRESKDLLRGLAWVDAETYKVRQLSGQPSKSPSWWVKRVDVTLRFGDVSGMWLVTTTDARAEVRWFGTHMLNSRALHYDTESLAASATVRPRPIVVPEAKHSAQLPRHQIPMMGTTVVVPAR